MTAHDCQWCGAPNEQTADPSEPLAANFCQRCDMPLFVRKAEGSETVATMVAQAPRAAPDDESDYARHRQPGDGGLESRTVVACWNCQEPNQPEPGTCQLCHSTLPKPENPPAVPAKPTPCADRAGRIVVSEFNPPTWLLLTFGGILAILTVILLDQVAPWSWIF